MEMTERRREMFALVEASEGSGLSRKEFCSRHGLKAWRNTSTICPLTGSGASSRPSIR